MKEVAASDYLHQWDGLVARVLPTGSGYTFSGAMLPFRPEIAGRLHAVLDGLPDNARQLLQELPEQGELHQQRRAGRKVHAFTIAGDPRDLGIGKPRDVKRHGVLRIAIKPKAGRDLAACCHHFLLDRAVSHTPLLLSYTARG